jgi:hypothetical protein
MTIVNRIVKGSALTHTELDGNFTDLDTRATTATADAVALDTRITAVESASVLYAFGIEDYNSTIGSVALTANVPLKMQNNGAGTNTNTAYKIPGRGSIWNTTTNQFEFNTAGLVLGDTVTIRMDLSVTVNAADNVSIAINMAVGSAFPYTLKSDYRQYRAAGTYDVISFMEVYMGDTNSLNFPAEVVVTSDSVSDSVVYNGHYVKYSLRLPSAT